MTRTGARTATKSRAEDETQAEAPRLRFVSAEVDRAPGSRLRIRVSLELEGSTHEAETTGVGLDTVEMRLAAEATLTAIRRAFPDSPEFQLVGIKEVQAFDAHVVLLGLLDPRGGIRLIGAVAVEESLATASAKAVLDATNRVLARSQDGDSRPVAGDGGDA